MSTPAAFTSPLSQALLTNPGLGRQSPTMARKKEKRRISKEQLALAVRKNFNGAAVSETDVVVDLLYKVKNQGMLESERYGPGASPENSPDICRNQTDEVADKAFRLRSIPSIPTAVKKP